MRIALGPKRLTTQSRGRRISSRSSLHAASRGAPHFYVSPFHLHGKSYEKIVHAVILILAVASSNCSAQAYGGIPDKFFSYIKQGKTNEAIDYVYGTNKWVSKNSDQFINLKNQLGQLNKLVGAYQFHELIVEEKVGTKYAHLVFLVGYERQPLRFELKMYMPEQEWRFHGVSFDANLTEDIEKQVNASLAKK